MSTFFEILVTIGFLGALMWGMMKFMLRDIHKDLVEIKNVLSKFEDKIEKNESRVDHLYEETNRLYQTLIEIVRNK